MFKPKHGFLYFVVVSVKIWSIFCFTQDEDYTLIDGLKPLVLNCLEECNLEQEDLKQENMSPCFKKCFLTKIGMMNKDGEYHQEEVMKQIKLYTDNEEDTKKVQEALEECFEGRGKIESDDERIDIMYECFMYY